MPKTDDTQWAEHVFGADERASLYKTILNRRDVRGQFLVDEIPNDVLARVLVAAHHAPSVGFMQPWNFLIIKDNDVRGKVHDIFKSAQQESTDMFDQWGLQDTDDGADLLAEAQRLHKLVSEGRFLDSLKD